MKRNLLIKRYLTEFDNGTKNMKSVKCYFGTNLIDIEDTITIDNLSIIYKDNDGYQNYENNINETEKLINLTNLKNNNHSIKIQTQDNFNIENNTKWSIDINIKNILIDYLFGKIKEVRTFKTIKKEDTKKNDINLTIYDFINFNILNRYKLNKIDLFIKYSELKSNNIFNKSLFKYNPIFDGSIFNQNYIVNDYNLLKKDEFENLTPIKILYNQNKKSNDFKFDYYFNIIYEKI